MSPALFTDTRPPVCPLFVELCAGLAAVSVRLQGGSKARPPVSRMGNKAGYANAILGAVGLKPGDRAGAYVWCEPDDGCRSLLMAYPQPEVLKEAARIIRSWADEDPRELWERLRAEGPIRGAGGREVARHLWLLGRSYNVRGIDAGFMPDKTSTGKDVWTAHPPEHYAKRLEEIPADFPPTTIHPDARHLDPSEVARWLRIVSSNRLVNLAWTGERWDNTGEGGGTFGGSEFCTAIPNLVDGVEQVPTHWPPVAVVADGRVVDAREVGRWLTVHRLTVPQAACRGAGPGDFINPAVAHIQSGEGQAQALSMGVDWPPTLITDDARTLEPPRLPEGAVVFCDPPYQGTTGYGNDLPRDEVLSMCRKWADAGATVIISEACPLGSIVHDGIADAEPGPLDGWHCYEITLCRKGQKRTFSKQQREWLTMSRPADAAWAEALALRNKASRDARAALVRRAETANRSPDEQAQHEKDEGAREAAATFAEQVESLGQVGLFG